MTSGNATSSRELFFLYELAKAFAASLDLPEVTEYVLDGACALLWAEQGFIFSMEPDGALATRSARGLNDGELRFLAEHLPGVVTERRAMTLEHPRNTEGAILAAPL